MVYAFHSTLTRSQYKNKHILPMIRNVVVIIKFIVFNYNI